VKLLLDTHVLLWWLADAPELSPTARERIADRSNFVMVSAASIWEIRIKESIGKLSLPTDFEALVRRESFEWLSITAEHAHATRELPLHHRDPFDRLLIAQARCEGVALLTHDRGLSVYDVEVVV